MMLHQDASRHAGTPNPPLSRGAVLIARPDFTEGCGLARWCLLDR